MLTNGDVSFPAQKEDFRTALISLYASDETPPQCIVQDYVYAVPEPAEQPLYNQDAPRH